MQVLGLSRQPANMRELFVHGQSLFCHLCVTSKCFEVNWERAWGKLGREAVVADQHKGDSSSQMLASRFVFREVMCGVDLFYCAHSVLFCNTKVPQLFHILTVNFNNQ